MFRNDYNLTNLENLPVNNEAVLFRIGNLMHELGYNRGQFADKIGMDRSGFYKRMSGEVSTGNAVINKIVLSLGVNKDWLTTGVGEKFKSDICLDKTTINDFNGVVYCPIPIITSSGYDAYIKNCSDEKFIKSLYTIPQKIDSFFGTKYRVLQIVGDSMNDKTSRSILNNDLVLGREVDRKHFIVNCDYLLEKIYVIVVGGGILVKQLVSIDNKLEIATFSSLNPIYENLSIKLNDIIEFYSVTKIVERAI